MAKISDQRHNKPMMINTKTHTKQQQKSTAKVPIEKIRIVNVWAYAESVKWIEHLSQPIQDVNQESPLSNAILQKDVKIRVKIAIQCCILVTFRFIL